MRDRQLWRPRIYDSIFILFGQLFTTFFGTQSQKNVTFQKKSPLLKLSATDSCHFHVSKIPILFYSDTYSPLLLYSNSKNVTLQKKSDFQKMTLAETMRNQQLSLPRVYDSNFILFWHKLSTFFVLKVKQRDLQKTVISQKNRPFWNYAQSTALTFMSLIFQFYFILTHIYCFFLDSKSKKRLSKKPWLSKKLTLAATMHDRQLSHPRI